MKPTSKSAWNPVRLDVRAFAVAGQTLQGSDELARFERLNAEAMSEVSPTSIVKWQCRGEIRSDQRGADVPWLHLSAEVEVPLSCQRCLGPVLEKLVVDRWFRFVADEATAELEDDDSEEDVLALEPRPDLLMLLEDELLMALPLVPMHEECPVAVPMNAGDLESGAEDVAPRENPFAQLAKLKK